MTRLPLLCGVLLLGALLAPAQQDLSIQVQIHYTGSGTVDETHKIVIALWDTAVFVENSVAPVAIKTVSSKNGVATFTGVTKTPAYVSVAYDPSGQWDGQSGPPPNGASLGMYSKAPPKPQPITPAPGKPAKVSITFDDSNKFQQ